VKEIVNGCMTKKLNKKGKPNRKINENGFLISDFVD